MHTPYLPVFSSSSPQHMDILPGFSDAFNPFFYLLLRFLYIPPLPEKNIL